MGGCRFALYRMKNRQSLSPKNRMTVSSNHPLVGVWREKKNPEYTTPCVLTIAVEDGQFFLREVDESDGVVLWISDIIWDGERLHFVTLFPPTKHKAMPYLFAHPKRDSCTSNQLLRRGWKSHHRRNLEKGPQKRMSAARTNSAALIRFNPSLNPPTDPAASGTSQPYCLSPCLSRYGTEPA